VTRALSAVALLALSACQPDAPTEFGVNVTIDPTALSTSARMHVAEALLTVTGDVPDPYAMPLDIHSQLVGKEVRFRYLPVVHSGELGFHLALYDGAQNLLGDGSSDMVPLVDNSAVEVKLVLARHLTCAQSDDCPDGFSCADRSCVCSHGDGGC